MRIDSVGQVALMKLSGLDLELNQILASLQALIESPEQKALQLQLTESAEEVLLARTNFENVQTSIKRSEEDIRLVTERLIRDRERLNATSSPKDAIGIQSEIDSLAKRKDELESLELEILEKFEQAQLELDSVSSKRANLQEQLSSLQEKLTLEINELKAKGRQATADRAILVAQIPADVLAKYEIMASKQVAVGRIVDRACNACHMVISSAAIEQLAKLPEDEIGNCPECQALIIR